MQVYPAAFLGQRLKVMIDAAQNYHATLAENRKLYNEIQELKGTFQHKKISTYYRMLYHLLTRGHLILA